MKIEVNNNEIELFDNCVLDFEVGTNLIYGYNNSGKTSLLAYIDYWCDKSFANRKEYCYSLMLPTNRIRLDYGDFEKWEGISGGFEFKRKKDRINQYAIIQKRISKRDTIYESHLKNIRGQLLTNRIIKNVIFGILKDLFNISYNENEVYSDGIENVVNIYLNIIWLALICENVSDLNFIASNDQIIDLLHNARIVIEIDEIELYLHVSILDKFLQNIEKMFRNAILIYSTHSALVLSRIDAKAKYRINGLSIDRIDENLFYQSIDKINETNFDVQPWPKEIKEAMLILERIALSNTIDNKNKLYECMEIIRRYENISNEYADLISYVENITLTNDNTE